MNGEKKENLELHREWERESVSESVSGSENENDGICV